MSKCVTTLIHIMGVISAPAATNFVAVLRYSDIRVMFCASRLEKHNHDCYLGFDLQDLQEDVRL